MIVLLEQNGLSSYTLKVRMKLLHLESKTVFLHKASPYLLGDPHDLLISAMKGKRGEKTQFSHVNNNTLAVPEKIERNNILLP